MSDISGSSIIPWTFRTDGWACADTPLDGRFQGKRDVTHASEIVNAAGEGNAGPSAGDV